MEVASMPALAGTALAVTGGPVTTALLGTGAALAYFGHSLYESLLRLVGFLVGFPLGVAVVGTYLATGGSASGLESLGAALVGGFVGGTVVASLFGLLERLTVAASGFFAGALGGAAITGARLVEFEGFVDAAALAVHNPVVVGELASPLVAGLGVVGALAALWVYRTMIVVATAAVGAALVSVATTASADLGAVEPLSLPDVVFSAVAVFSPWFLGVFATGVAVQFGLLGATGD